MVTWATKPNHLNVRTNPGKSHSQNPKILIINHNITVPKNTRSQSQKIPRFTKSQSPKIHKKPTPKFHEINLNLAFNKGRKNLSSPRMGEKKKIRPPLRPVFPVSVCEILSNLVKSCLWPSSPQPIAGRSKRHDTAKFHIWKYAQSAMWNEQV